MPVVKGTADEADAAPDDIRAPEFSDEALALRFAERHQRNLRYVVAWARWMVWDGNRWRADEKLAAFDMVRQVTREAANACNEKSRLPRELASAKTVYAIERLAKADQRLAATVDQWDADPQLLNTPEATIDLRTGRPRPHRQADYQTKVTGTSLGDGCPTWFQFIDRITAGNRELAAFIQRMLGYAATGLTSEHALFFLYGTGANGKSVLLSTVAGVLGDYALTATMETLTESRNERHLTELARLRGARFVSATETEQGRHWAEARIKTITGGDKITANFMRQDHFEFTPCLKLFVAGNHKPGLRSVDEAMRRRLKLVPFMVTIPPKERDPQLGEKLRVEWPGILRWIVEGCLEWQRIGLAPPDAVRDATDAYFDAQDAMGAWLEEKCDRDADAWESLANLFGSWKAWGNVSGESPMARTDFSDELERRGFAKRKRNTGTGFLGIRLVPSVAGGRE